MVVNHPSQTKVACITGSGRNRVGNVIARKLAEQGYSIALHYHSSEKSARVTREEFRGVGVECEIYKANVAVENDVERMFDTVERDFGRLDVLVTTAAVWESLTLEDTTADDLWRNFNVNTLGTFLCARRAGLQMAGQPEGSSIIAIGDWAISRPYLNHSAYFISKGAITTLTHTLAVELAHRNPNVRVNCIHPGPEMFPPDASDEEREQMRQSTLAKRANCPESVADAVTFLIDNSFVTGACLPVDGGRSVFAQEINSKGRAI